MWSDVVLAPPSTIGWSTGPAVDDRLDVAYDDGVTNTLVTESLYHQNRASLKWLARPIFE
jgi:hypothetical protein